jgi:hypothetical protein
MSVTIASGTIVSGGAQTGFTSPTYTFTTDIAPSIYGRQWAITGVGGTQVGVAANSAAKPFSVTVVRPASLKASFAVNPQTGAIIGAVPKNSWKVIVRKGMDVLANNPPQLGSITLDIKIPAGVDLMNSGAEARAMLSALQGFLTSQGAGLGDSLVSAVL